MTDRCPRCHGAGWIAPEGDGDRIPVLRAYFVPCPDCDAGRVREKKEPTDDAR
jgi:hypothetical protein